MPYLQVYDAQINLTYQVEIDEQTATKARENPHVTIYNQPIAGLRVLPRSRYLRDRVLAAEGPDANA